MYIYTSDILKIYSFNIALLQKYISQFTDHPLFTLGSIPHNKAPVYCEMLPSQGGKYGESTLPVVSLLRLPSWEELARA